MPLNPIGHIKALCAILLNVIVPGAGFVAAGHLRWAISVQALLGSSIILMCWTRWILTPAGCKALLALIGLIFLLNTLGLIVKIFKTKHPWTLKNTLLASLFSVACLGALLVGFKTKDQWLGVHIYFVPSASMEPTLKPGQFILLDTWAYYDKTPSLDDVVVFEHGIKKTHLVKRINHWPKGELTQKGLWYVIGDNRNLSQDSRYFGGIAIEQVIGEVKLVLVAFDHKQPLKVDILLTSVH